eukprot:4693615-Amphidinium_carterae.3
MHRSTVPQIAIISLRAAMQLVCLRAVILVGDTCAPSNFGLKLLCRNYVIGSVRISFKDQCSDASSLYATLVWPFAPVGGLVASCIGVETHGLYVWQQCCRRDKTLATRPLVDCLDL